LVFAIPQVEQNSTISTTEEQSSSADQADTLNKTQKIQELLTKKENLDKEIIDNNIWSKIYSNYHIYIEFKKDKAVLDDQINILDTF